ncbi:hypothetical protein PsYK624_027960 [Phanerochaete sordida]|uniref:Tocopherol cyclase n=1 Tax=Phanerochaete sordida TaxID=48140 RepID=A0A9P3G2Z7_9APHY|nr:hypothetical protein PsYK624_027960 [Phanerochaete sordida]
MSLLSFARRSWEKVYRAVLSYDHFAPHPYPRFEGYYSRTQLDDGGTLAVIFCWVKNAPKRANLVHVSYTPPASASPSTAFKHELYPDQLEITTHQKRPDGQQPFTIHMPGVGTMNLEGDSVEYTVETSDPPLSLSLKISKRVPWSAITPLAGPMGVLAVLSRLLPLNWHVFCTSSKATYAFTHAGRTQRGTGTAHVEKNWGSSFPPGWIWSQAFAGGAPRTSLCLAGGAALPGVHAYLVGYRSAARRWDFRPPWALAVWPLPGFLRVAHDSAAGTFALDVRTPTRRLVVTARAPPASFIALACPLAGGHEPSFAYESFVARTHVAAWERRWPWQPWVLVEEGPCGVTAEGTPCAALEFGGVFSHLVRERTEKED